MYAARFDDPIAHTSALTGLIGGAIAGAVVGAALVATVATGGLAAPLVIGAALSGAAVGAWAGEYLGSLSFFSDITGKITAGSPNVHVNSKPQARVMVDIGECKKARPCIPMVATGSGNVYINSHPAARVDDKMTCGAFIKAGSPNVRIGGGTVQYYLDIESDVPGWVHAVVIGAGVAGALLLGGWAAIPALVGAFAVGYVGGEALGWVGKRYGEFLSERFGGLPSDWEKSGVFAGQAVGGILGAKGGSKAWDMYTARSSEPSITTFRSEYGVIEEKIQVEAVGEIKGKYYYDTNQTARNPARANSEERLAIYDKVAPKEAKSLAKGKSPFPNKTMADAHAEVAVIHQAMKAGSTKGQDMTIRVMGDKEVCNFCKSDLKSMAEEAGLRSLRVEDMKGMKVMIWRQGAKNWEIFPIGH
ncbi:MAG: PAAR domain-containing protein [Chloracidobacterium sp.]|nr:PAAR domain-containing protein [Chloracidobacterium sp.]